MLPDRPLIRRLDGAAIVRTDRGRTNSGGDRAERSWRNLMHRRLQQLALIASTLGFCWLGTQIVHELGHVLAAWVGGETVERVVLHPLVISRTDVSRDRHPLLVVWGGPVVGSLVPLGMLAVARATSFEARLFVSVLRRVLPDHQRRVPGRGIVRARGRRRRPTPPGAPRWSLIAFGLVCAPVGLWLWNGLGPRFGLGEARGEVDREAVAWTVGLVAIIVLVEVLAGGG